MMQGFGMEGALTRRMAARASTDGIPSAISRSKRPARRSAVSSASGLFVAPAAAQSVSSASSLKGALANPI